MEQTTDIPKTVRIYDIKNDDSYPCFLSKNPRSAYRALRRLNLMVNLCHHNSYLMAKPSSVFPTPTGGRLWIRSALGSSHIQVIISATNMRA